MKIHENHEMIYGSCIWVWVWLWNDNSPLLDVKSDFQNMIYLLLQLDRPRRSEFRTTRIGKMLIQVWPVWLICCCCITSGSIDSILGGGFNQLKKYESKWDVFPNNLGENFKKKNYIEPRTFRTLLLIIHLLHQPSWSKSPSLTCTWDRKWRVQLDFRSHRKKLLSCKKTEFDLKPIHTCTGWQQIIYKCAYRYMTSIYPQVCG